MLVTKQGVLPLEILREYMLILIPLKVSLKFSRCTWHNRGHISWHLCCLCLLRDLLLNSVGVVGRGAKKQLQLCLGDIAAFTKVKISLMSHIKPLFSFFQEEQTGDGEAGEEREGGGDVVLLLCSCSQRGNRILLSVKHQWLRNPSNLFFLLLP